MCSISSFIYLYFGYSNSQVASFTILPNFSTFLCKLMKYSITKWTNGTTMLALTQKYLIECELQKYEIPVNRNMSVYSQWCHLGLYGLKFTGCMTVTGDLLLTFLLVCWLFGIQVNESHLADCKNIKTIYSLCFIAVGIQIILVTSFQSTLACTG